jgi:hypothetical protein
MSNPTFDYRSRCQRAATLMERVGIALVNTQLPTAKLCWGAGVDVRLDFLQCGRVWRGYRDNEP